MKESSLRASQSISPSSQPGLKDANDRVRVNKISFITADHRASGAAEDFAGIQEQTHKLFGKYNEILLVPSTKIKNLPKVPNIDILLDCKIPSHATVFDPGNQREAKLKNQAKVTALMKAKMEDSKGNNMVLMNSR